MKIQMHKVRSSGSSPRSRAAGLTLIEVVAAIAIIGTILVGVVLAKSRHTRQLALSQRKLEAVHALDAQLAKWWAGGDDLPVNTQGTFTEQRAAESTPPTRPMMWRTRLVANHEVENLGARVLRIEVVQGEDYDSENEPLTSVDLVLRRETEPEKPDKAEADEAGEMAEQPLSLERGVANQHAPVDDGVESR